MPLNKVTHLLCEFGGAYTQFLTLFNLENPLKSKLLDVFSLSTFETAIPLAEPDNLIMAGHPK